MISSNIPDEAQLMTGINIAIEELGITIRQPTVKEISMIGETDYFIALRLFTMTKQQLSLTNDDITNWMIFQKTSTQKITGIADTKVLILNFLQLFFEETINIGPNSLLLVSKDGIKNIEPEDFDDIQRIIGAIGGKNLLVPQEEKFNPKNKRAEEIANKMKKARERLSRIKAIENGVSEKSKKGFLKRYIHTVALGTPNSLKDTNDMTLYQLNDMMQGCIAREAYDIEVRGRLMGAKGDKELIHWSMADSNDNDSIGKV